MFVLSSWAFLIDELNGLYIFFIQMKYWDNSFLGVLFLLV